jgi:voltage-gated potassium channel Kch
MRKGVLGLLCLAGFLCAQQGARLLVIAYDQYVPQLQDFADWKTKRGMLTRVVPLSEVGSSVDDIRNYVLDAYNTWNPQPEFLLLVGYGGQVPAYRYYSGIFTDNYVADMTGNYRAELNYGRLPCKTVRQCSVMVAKTLGYERTPYLGDTLWFRTGMTIVREDYGDDDTIYWNNAHVAMTHMRNNGFAGFDSFSSARGDDATDVQNSVTAGKSFVLYRGQATVNWYSPFSVNPGATSNGYMLPVVLSATCYTVTLAPNESMVGDAWLRAGSVASPQGAVAFFGNTHGTGNVAGLRGALSRGFMQAYFQDSVATLGEAALAGKAQLDTEYHEPIDYQGFNLLGDPTLLCWTAKPFPVEVEYDSVVPPGAGSFSVRVRKDGQPLRKAVVCVRKGSEVYEWGVTDAQGSVALAIAPTSPGLMEVTVTGRNVLPFEGAARVLGGDAGVAAIVKPGAFIPPGAISPLVRVMNCGSNAITFPVVFRITDSSGALSYRDTATASGLAPGETMQVSFAAWSAQNGRYTVICSTRLADDAVPANDTLSRQVWVVTNDVGVSRIIVPAGILDSSVVVVPSAEVRNSGSRPETFKVFFGIGGWNDSVQVADLAVGDSATVVFDTWPKPHAPQVYTARCSTWAAGDQNPGNDTASVGFMVVVLDLDVGVDRIIAPAGSFDSSVAVAPSARVSNPGARVATFKVFCRISDGWSDSVQVTDLAAGDSALVVFDTWPKPHAVQGYAVQCSTWAAGDMCSGNDVASGEFTVTGPDLNVAVKRIIAPVGPFDSSVAVAPSARVSNLGSRAATFKVFFRVSDGWWDSVQVADLATGDSATVVFDTWPKPHIPGGYTMRCSTYLAGDVNHGDDAIGGSFLVTGSVPPPVPAWTQMSGVPPGSKNKSVKDGGALAYGKDNTDANDTGYVYAFKGNNTYEFYRYNTLINAWFPRESIPAYNSNSKKKSVKKGSSLAVAGNGRVYATKGNGTLDFWVYDPAARTWIQLPDVPAGAKPLKEGVGAAAVQVGGNDYIYLLKGSGTYEFYCYNVATGVWDVSLPTAPAGASGKPYKNGSAIAFGGGDTIYCLKGSYNEFAVYSISGRTWQVRDPLPLIGSSGKKKKAKAGAGLAAATGAVYGLKGGNTNEFYQHKTTDHKWYAAADMPTLLKRVNGGGALVYADANQSLYAFRGNKTLEFWSYGPLSADGYSLAASREPKSVQGQSAGRSPQFALSIAPSLFTYSSNSSISYSLPTAGFVRLGLYDMTGRQVRTLASAEQTAGSYTLRWDGRDEHGEPAPEGVYFLRMSVSNAGFTSSRRLMLVR